MQSIYNSPYQAQTMYNQSYRQTAQQLTRVTGVEGAKAYQMPPNSVAPLFDSGSDIMYIKSTDDAGFPTIRAFSFAPLDNTPPPQLPALDLTQYVTREEFNALREELSNAKQPVRKSAAKPTDAE